MQNSDTNNSIVRMLMELTKFRIALLATASAAPGYLLAAQHVSWTLASVLAGVLVLACGSLALNQWQEQDVDRIMPRTSRRPLPSGRLKPAAGFAVSVALIAAGSGLIALTGHVPFALGLLCVLWYNGVYTPLKRRTAFAVIPGALIGALPPVIGWTAAGGSLSDPAVLAIAVFFFIWQVPHFWLLLYKYGKQYEDARLKSLTEVFSLEQLTRITFVWVLATALSCLLLPLYGAIQTVAAAVAISALALLLVLASGRLLLPGARNKSVMTVFGAINLYALGVMVLLGIDRFMRPG